MGSSCCGTHNTNVLLCSLLFVDVSRGARTRARHLDADQRQAILTDAAKKQASLHPDHLDVDKPGLGLFYCIECDRHFPSEVDRSVHTRSKLHKRVAKRMHEEKAYTVEESLWAAGIGVDNRQRGGGGSGNGGGDSNASSAERAQQAVSKGQDAASSATTAAPRSTRTLRSSQGQPS